MEEAAAPLSGGVVVLDTRLYPELCLREATAAYAPFLTVSRRSSDARRIALEIHVRPEHSAETLRIRREYLNFLLDLSIRQFLSDR